MAAVNAGGTTVESRRSGDFNYHCIAVIGGIGAGNQALIDADYPVPPAFP